MSSTSTQPRRFGPPLSASESRLTRWPVLKDLLLVLLPEATWDRIAAAQHRVGFIFSVYLLPMLLLAGGVEGSALWRQGRQQLAAGHPIRFTVSWIVVYEAAQMFLLVVLLLVCAGFIKMFGNTCRRRNEFAQSLTVMLHAVGPLLLLQLLNGINGFPPVFPWVTWAVGAALMVGTMYHGLPRVLQPDTPSALGLYIGSAFVVLPLLALGRFFTWWYLTGHLKPLEKTVAELAARLSP